MERDARIHTFGFEVLLEHPPIEGLLYQTQRSVTAINLGLFGLSRFLPGYHLIKQLTDEPKRIDLVIMLARGKTQEL